jgi:hypothetical protein
MSMLVKADDVAIQASHNFLQVLDNQVQGAFTALQNSGQVLVDVAHWAGADADKFRGDVWPKVETDLKQIASSLRDLQLEVDKVLGNIMKAGGN